MASATGQAMGSTEGDGRRRTRLLIAVLATTALSASVVPAPSAVAQGRQAEGMEELVVTARRREETLQSVPLAVSALTAADLEELQANTLDALQGAVPNLNIVQGRGSTSSVNVFIRGVGQPDALQTFDPGVGVYADGVFLSRIQGSLLTLFDVERVEVLRGPQGTLYGKNAIGGAINVISRTPGDEPEFQGRITYGRFDKVKAEAYAGGPLVDGKLSASFAATYDRRDGIVTDPATGQRFNDDETFSGRAKVVATPTDTLELVLSADYTNQDSALALGRAEADLIQTDLFTDATTVLLPAPTTEYDFTGSTSFTMGEGQELEHWGVSLTANWDIDDSLSLVSITAYRQLDPDFFIDIDATEFRLGDVFVFIDQNQVSQELQLQYDGGGRVSGVFGLYFLREELASDQFSDASDAFTFAGAEFPFLTFIEDGQVTRSYAAFGEFDFDLTDRITVTAGLRYTYEEKDFQTRRLSLAGGAPFLSFPITVPTVAALEDVPFFEDSEDFDSITPRLIVRYQATDDSQLYASISRGFKSGGFNGRAARDEETVPFDPETVWTFEAGTKNDLADGRLRLNAAAFYNLYSDFQARVARLVDPDNPLSGFAFPVLNAAELETYGFELEALARPVDGLQLAGSVGFLEARYTEGDFVGSEPAFSPRWSLRFGASYEYGLGSGLGFITVGGDVVHISDHFLSVDNADVLTEDGYVLLSAFVTWRSEDDRYHVAFGGRNLTDEVYRTDAQEFSALANIQTAYYGDPRTWTVSVGVNF